ncbi:MAG: fibronectin type III domain-containing protein, partial [Phycisphaerae bacterium]
MCNKLVYLVSFVLVLGMVAGVASGRPVKINFQQAGGEVPEEYLPDYGEVFGDRGNGWSYGWNRDIQADSRDRGSGNAPDQRYDTLLHLQKAANAIWEIELPNGEYELFLVCGDPGYTDQTNNFDVEGVILEDPDGQAGTGFDFDEFNVTAIVADGRLTIQPAEGSSNCKIMFLDILGGVELVKAYRAIPDDGVLHPDTWANLGWSAGDSAASHDVYFGDNFDDVSAGAESTFQGNQTTTFFVVGFPGFPYPDGLVPGTTYYWRVDEIEADGITIHKGDVWSFSIPPKTAYAP